MARAPKASFDLPATAPVPHELQVELDDEVARLNELKLNPANSWLIEMSSARVKALAAELEKAA